MGGLGVVADGEVGWATLTRRYARGEGKRIRPPHGPVSRAEPASDRAFALGRANAFDRLRGVSVAGYNYVAQQRGLTIGVYNDARHLKGIQLGLINRARNNSSGLRWLPLVNAHF